MLEREEAIEMLINGKSKLSVANYFKVSHTAIGKLWRKYMNYNTLKDLPKSGRPTKTSARERRNICRIAKFFPFYSSFKIREEVYLEKDISARTIRKILCENGLFGRISARKPYLNTKNKRLRMKFCKDYLHFSLSQWKNIIFSDESSFHRYSTIRKYVRRPLNSRFKTKYITRTIRYLKAKVMVWGAIKGDGSKILLKCPFKMNSVAYQQLLEREFFEFYDDENVLMQDNAPIHKSRSTTEYLENKGVWLLADWPSRSPDINIIENLWAVLKKKDNIRNATSSSDLWYRIKSEWDNISPKSIKTLYSSIPQRLRAIIRVKGDNSKY